MSVDPATSDWSNYKQFIQGISELFLTQGGREIDAADFLQTGSGEDANQKALLERCEISQRILLQTVISILQHL
jgi:hypothetical protein